jgi:hypothetical protein
MKIRNLKIGLGPKGADSRFAAKVTPESIEKVQRERTVERRKAQKARGKEVKSAKRVQKPKRQG